MRRYSIRPQRTICRVVELTGIGFLTGAEVRLRFVPAPPSSGVVFARVDLPGTPRIAAHVQGVTDTRRRTTLGQPPGGVTLVEHVLAALAGLRIDNCLIEVNAIEPPGLDGSSLRFVKVLQSAGIECQPVATKTVWAVDEPIRVEGNGATLTLHPPRPGDTGLTLSYFLDYGPTAPIGRQVFTCDLSPATFVQEICWSRTFLLEAEALEVRRQGLGTRITASDLLVFGKHGPIDNTLRKANEPARHKVLDLIGDLSLLGADLCGHVVACRSGHPLNVEMASVLYQRSAFSSQPSPVSDQPMRKIA